MLLLYSSISVILLDRPDIYQCLEENKLSWCSHWFPGNLLNFLKTLTFWLSDGNYSNSTFGWYRIKYQHLCYFKRKCLSLLAVSLQCCFYLYCKDYLVSCKFFHTIQVLRQLGYISFVLQWLKYVIAYLRWCWDQGVNVQSHC